MEDMATIKSTAAIADSIAALQTASRSYFWEAVFSLRVGIAFSIRKVNDNFSLFFCFPGELCGAAPSMRDIHHNKISLLKHPVVSAVDGKAGRDIFHRSGKQRLSKIICVFPGKAFQHCGIANMGIFRCQFAQRGVNKCVKRTLPTDIESVYLLIFNQIYQHAAQFGTNTVRAVPMAEKGATWQLVHLPVPIHDNMKCANSTATWTKFTDISPIISVV